MNLVTGKIMKMPFNDTMSLMVKVITVGCVVHESYTNFYEHKQGANKRKIFCFLSK